VVYDLGRTEFVNGTIRCAYFKRRFRRTTSIPGSLGVILAFLCSILVALGSQGTPAGPSGVKGGFGICFGRFCAFYLGAHFGIFSDNNLNEIVKRVKKKYLEKRNDKVMKRDPFI